MKIHYDKESDTLYIGLKTDGYVDSEEIKDGLVVDYDAEDRIIAMEFLPASRVTALSPEALEELAASVKT